MISEEIIKIKDLSEIKSNIVNYDVFDNSIAIATEKNEIFSIEYNIDIEEEIIKKIEALASRLEKNLSITNRDIKLFNKGFIVSMMYSVLLVVLSILTSSLIPLIFLVSSFIIDGKLITILKEYKKELKQTNLSLYILKSTLCIKQMEFKQKKSAEKCREIISKQSSKKSDSKLLKELREQLVEEPKEENDKIMTKHK